MKNIFAFSYLIISISSLCASIITSSDTVLIMTVIFSCTSTILFAVGGKK